MYYIFLGMGFRRVIDGCSCTIRQVTYDFLVFHCNFAAVLYLFLNIDTFYQNLMSHVTLNAPFWE